VSQLVSLIQHPTTHARWQAHAILLAARQHRGMSQDDFSGLLARQLRCPELTPAVLRAWEQRRAAPPNDVVQAALALLTPDGANGTPLRDGPIAQRAAPHSVANNQGSSRRDALVFAPGLSSAFVRTSALIRSDIAGHRGSADAEFSVQASVTTSRDWLVQQLTTAHARTITVSPTTPSDAFIAFQELDTQQGGGFARGALLEHLSARFIQQKTRSQGGSRPDATACATTSELLYLAGLTAFDTGLLGLAQRYLTQALRLAQEANIPGFAANVIAALSHLAITAGHVREAIHLANAGLAALSCQDVPAVRMRLQLMHARGHALNGDRAACRAALRSAEHSHACATLDRTPRWARYLNMAFLAGEAALCFETLADHAQAIAWAERSIQESRNRGRRRLLSFAVLARAHAQAGDVDQSLAVGHQALDLFEGGIRSWRAQCAIHELSRQVTALGEPRAGQDFHQRLRDLNR